MNEFVTRFAPSPTGFLHIGHAFSALEAFNAARKAGGRFILRLEDIDTTRSRPEFEEAVYEDLAWLGLEWETPVRRQSEYFEDYAGALQKLIDLGVVYRCFKTRKEIADDIARAPHLAPEGPEGPQYIGDVLSAYEERSLLAEGAPFAWRLSMKMCREKLGGHYQNLTFTDESGGAPRKITATPEIFGDVVIARKDLGTSYHLASVFDDGLQGVTRVIRGEDLRAAPHLHVLLQRLLGLPSPVYRHHPLITDEMGKRLAKRDNAQTIRALREKGETPQDIKRRLGLD